MKTKIIYKKINIKNNDINNILKILQKEGKIRKVGPNYNWHWEKANNDEV